jgi:hypothetical protein
MKHFNAMIAIWAFGCSIASLAQSADEPWKSLFNGTDLTGWKVVALRDPAPAVIEDREMILRQRINTVEHTFCRDRTEV